MISQNVIKTYSLMTYFNVGYMAEALGMSLFHYVLALSSYVRGISVITPPPYWGGPVGGSGFVAISFFFISFAYKYSMNFLSFLIFFI